MTPPPSQTAALPAYEPRRSEAAELEASERRERLRQRLKRVALPLMGAGVFVAIWALYTSIQGVTLPGPLQTLQQSWNFIAHPFFDNGPNDKGLAWHLLASLSRVAMGYGLAVLVGVSLGIFIGKVTMAHQALDPIFQVLRTIPPLAWLPLSLATFNKAQPSAVFVIFITALWPILINTSVGVTRIPKDYDNLRKIYGMRGSRYFFLILLPAAAPYIFTGLRISIGMAWLAIVAAEMLTGGVGIGFFIWDSWNSSRMSDIIVSVAYVGAVGYLLDRLVAALASRFGAKND